MAICTVWAAFGTQHQQKPLRQTEGHPRETRPRRRMLATLHLITGGSAATNLVEHAGRAVNWHKCLRSERLQKVTQELETIRTTSAGWPHTRPTAGVDTRLIGKPDQFSGGANWRDWSVVPWACETASAPALRRTCADQMPR
eukprot:359410-Amphidinium_carterae.1